jgi:hypothetical protein
VAVVATASECVGSALSGLIAFLERGLRPYPFAMALDTDVVLWALRGLHDPKRGGVRADHVARFMSKDATLTEYYSSDDVTEVLESLVAEGTLTHAATTGADEFGETEPSRTPVLYRFASLDSVVAGRAPRDEWDDWLKLGADPLPDLVSESLPDLSMLVRVYELEQERDALKVERETWHRRAESAELEIFRARSEAEQEIARTRDEAEQEISRARDEAEEEASRARTKAEQSVTRALGETTEIRTRLRALEKLLKRERAAAAERLTAASRTAEGLARARDELESLAPTDSDIRFQPQTTRDPKTLRGNWLE